jgi:DNA-binding response OmpR family regulator
MEARRVLVVEDEPITRRLLEGRLRAAGHQIATAESAEVALDLLSADRFALLLTDLHLSRMDGIALMATARKLDPELELIVITGGATIDSAIAAMDTGACAYVRKPLIKGELEQRVADALARRHERVERNAALRELSASLRRIAEPEAPLYKVGDPQPALQQLGPLAIDGRRRQVRVAGRSVPLSPGEFDLLSYLARHHDVPIAPEQLMRDVCHYSCTLDEARELIKARVYRLRQKIEADPANPKLLVSVRGAGYMLTAGD